MKKFICGVIAALTIAVVVAPKQAEAQVVLSNICCDQWNVPRCYQINWTPINGLCYCDNQGYGHTC